MMRKTIFNSRTSEAGAGGRGHAQTREPGLALSSRKVSALSAVVLAVALAWMPNAVHALSLGKVQVQSALGEAMLAEIDLNDVSAAEAANLTATIASPDVFKSMGVDYNGALTTTKVTVGKRTNGSTYLKLTGDKVVNDPFVDMIIEVTWSSGRLVRDFTLLFDPRNLMPQPAVQAQLPVTNGTSAPSPSVSRATSAPETTPIKASVTSASASTIKPSPAPKVKVAGGVSAKVAPATSSTATPKASSQSDAAKSLTVKEGDTAGRIAQRNLTGNVSLDQMLAAMLRSNPDAFINGDINRIKAGAVIDTPSAATAAQIKPEEARQILVATARDFGKYKQRAAQLVPTQTTEKPARQTTGKVEAKVVEDKKSTTTNPDKLKLAKGSVQTGQASASQPTPAQSIAQSKQVADTRERAAELNKNLADLAKISAAAGAGKPPSPPASAPAPSVSAKSVAQVAVTPSTVSASAPAFAASVAATTASSGTAPLAAASSAASAASAASSAATPQTAASAPPAVTQPKPKAPPPPPPEPSFLDTLTENPLIPAGAAGLIAALLGGFAIWRRRKAKLQHVDSSFLESRLQPDSFFGASGGQMVNTEDQPPVTGSSMIYSPSQLDAAGDVDPVAEAEVYMAYGRDLQAEEILKEALRVHGSRVSIHTKLLEIYAKRRDAKAFELVAQEVYNLCNGLGPDWEHICNLGRALDPMSPLYQPGGKPSDLNTPSITDAGIGAASFAASTMPHQLDVNAAAAAQTSSAPEIDLDLDLDIFSDNAPASAPANDGFDFDIEPTVAINPQPASAPPAPDFSLDTPPAPVAPVEGTPLEFSLDDFSSPAPATSEPAPSTPATDPPPLSFDLGSLSLDLPASGSSSEEAEEEDPMNTKLELATEFYALGDVEGARAIAEEVANEASGGLKAKAQKMLSQWL
jgi:pilus assembly protein FimV